MKTKLTVNERFTLLAMLPGASNLRDMLIVDDLRKQIGFSEEDNKRLSLKWSNEKFAIGAEKILTECLQTTPVIVCQEVAGKLSKLVPQTRIEWDKDADGDGAETEFGPRGIEIVQNTIDRLDKEGNVNAEVLAVARKLYDASDLGKKRSDKPVLAK